MLENYESPVKTIIAKENNPNNFDIYQGYKSGISAVLQQSEYQIINIEMPHIGKCEYLRHYLYQIPIFREKQIAYVTYKCFDKIKQSNIEYNSWSIENHKNYPKILNIYIYTILLIFKILNSENKYVCKSLLTNMIIPYFSLTFDNPTEYIEFAHQKSISRQK